MKPKLNRPQTVRKADFSVGYAIKILSRHNLWRRGADIAMENPTDLGNAIDIVLRQLRRYRRRNRRLGAQ